MPITIINQENSKYTINRNRKMSFGSKSVPINVAKNRRESELLKHFSEIYDFPKQKPVQWGAKRFFDCLLSSCLLIPATPLLAVSGLLIKLDSKGPVFFKQKRIGKMGKEFTIYKLRTMSDKCHQKIPKTRAEDERVTRIGAQLRKLGIDELPQLINIIKGDMSLVGPRPLPADYVNQLIKENPESLRRAATLPGVAINYDEVVDIKPKPRIEAEKKYLDKWNFFSDFKELFMQVKRKFSTNSKH